MCLYFIKFTYNLLIALFTFQNNFSFDGLKALLEGLIEAVKCPVCLNTIQPTVNQCENGHGVCTGCRKRHNLCPVCRGTFLVFRNRLLDNVLELLPHNCSFSFNGCSEIIKPGDDHEKWCGFRGTKCKRCDWTGPGNKILNHIKFDHKDIVILKESSTDMFWRNIVPSRGFKNRIVTWFAPISAHGHFFWMKVTNDTQNNLFEKTFTLVKNGKKLEKTFLVKLVLKNLTKSYTVSTVLTVDSLLGSDDSERSINLHSSTVIKFVSPENKLNYMLFIEEADEKQNSVKL